MKNKITKVTFIGLSVLVGLAAASPILAQNFCRDSTCAINTPANCTTSAVACSTCTPPGGVGTLSVTVSTDAACSTGGTCALGSPPCTAADSLSAQATLSYTGCTTPGCINTARTVIVCEVWEDCSGGPVAGCGGCSSYSVTPGGASVVVAVSSCTPGVAGQYQYQVRAVDVQGTGCTCGGGACTNGCAGNCNGAGAISCCVAI